jgi:hypothetical protein
MKTTVLFAAFSIVALGAFLVWARFNDFDHSINISVAEDGQYYTFSAQYDPRATGKVEAYINKSISPDQMGSSINDYIDANTVLTDNTRFYIKEVPGKLKIRLDKKSNSTASYYRIKTMCDGLKSLMAGN